ncbi:nucleoside/nucleotide kinase family protein [Paenarthrobacter sp. NPDC018779]|uniref:nucleoside/nucleotide kinase family protein n=1 Tax=Paenarthrobacter sp. NPDC018779 TaxID=3364375 RepID=UPI0037CA0A86
MNSSGAKQTVPAVPCDIARLARRLRGAASPGGRLIIGLVGAPGAGKSTLAERLAGQFGPDGAVVPMDGFHLANSIIDGTPLRERKGAIDTFDVGGYLSLLQRLRRNDEEVIYAPAYRRGLEEPVAASIAVPKSTTFVLTEGNYLLARQGRWSEVRGYLDEVWFVETPQEIRVAQLIQRHVTSGMAQADAEAWANGPDEANARFIESTRSFADLIVRRR